MVQRVKCTICPNCEGVGGHFVTDKDGGHKVYRKCELCNDLGYIETLIEEEDTKSGSKVIKQSVCSVQFNGGIKIGGGPLDQRKIRLFLADSPTQEFDDLKHRLEEHISEIWKLFSEHIKLVFSGRHLFFHPYYIFDLCEKNLNDFSQESLYEPTCFTCHGAGINKHGKKCWRCGGEGKLYIAFTDLAESFSLALKSLYSPHLFENSRTPKLIERILKEDVDHILDELLNERIKDMVHNVNNSFRNLLDDYGTKVSPAFLKCIKKIKGDQIDEIVKDLEMLLEHRDYRMYEILYSFLHESKAKKINSASLYDFIRRLEKCKHYIKYLKHEYLKHEYLEHEYLKHEYLEHYIEYTVWRIEKPLKVLSRLEKIESLFKKSGLTFSKLNKNFFKKTRFFSGHGASFEGKNMEERIRERNL